MCLYKLNMAEHWCCHAACLFCRFASSCVYYGVSYNIKNLAGDRYLNVFLSGLVEIPSLIFVLLVNNRCVPIYCIRVYSWCIPYTFICLRQGSSASNGTGSVNLLSVFDTIVLYKISTIHFAVWVSSAWFREHKLRFMLEQRWLQLASRPNG